MPYSGPSDDSLPKDVRGWPKKLREIYVSAFNSVHKKNGGRDTGPAGNAYAIARAAALKYADRHDIELEGTEPSPPSDDHREFRFFSPLSLEEKDELPTWIPLHKVGHYHDPRYGKFSMTLGKMREAQANFYACTNRESAPIDAQVPVDQRHQGNDACAWLDAVAIREPYLLGRANWTEYGKEIIKDKRYRFISPLYLDDGKDVILKEAALTNRPVLDLPPVDAPIMLSEDVQETEKGVGDPKQIEEETNMEMNTLTEEAFMALDEDMKIDLYYRLADYGDNAPDNIIALRKWTRAFINDLPNAAFAVIEPAYSSGDTENKNARHLPHHTSNVKKATEDSTVDLPHYRNARARANQIKPVTDSISTSKLRSKAQSHLEGHKGVLKSEKEQEEPMPKDTMQLTEEQVKELQKLVTKNEELENKCDTLRQKLVSLEKERHTMLVESITKSALDRGVPPIVVKYTEPILLACNEQAETVIALEVGDEEEEEHNIFSLVVALLENIPDKLGTETEPPTSDKPPIEREQSFESRLEELDEAEKEVIEMAKELGWDDVVEKAGAA